MKWMSVWGRERVNDEMNDEMSEFVMNVSDESEEVNVLWSKRARKWTMERWTGWFIQLPFICWLTDEWTD